MTRNCWSQHREGLLFVWVISVVVLVIGVVNPSGGQVEEFKNGITHYDNHFFNNGHKKVKDSKWENSVLKSKVEVLGEVLKKHVQSLRNTPEQRVELVFLVDSSASVGHENFFNELKFVKKLLADFTVSWYAARVAVVTFSSKTRVIRHIDHISQSSLNNHKCILLEEELPNITYTGGGTYTLGAVLEAQSVLEGARLGAAKAVFLVTDGYSNGGDPRPAAQKLRKQGVEIFTFGIRNGNVRELFDMASEPQQEHSFILDSFEEFEALARRALHEDLQTGSYLPQPRSACNKLCLERSQCCHDQAECTCGTHTGHYACLCPAGHYGTGLRGDCHLCPGGTYRSTSGPGDVKSCTQCPDPNQISEPGSTSPTQCYCKRGFLAENGVCRMMACPKLEPPDNGYFVKNTCHSVFNAACGIRCHSGYKLVGSSIRLCQENGTWSGDDPYCVMRTCGDMKPPKNGRINCTTEEHVIDTECESSCDVGFSLVGSKKRTCLPIGYWDGLPAFCRAVHCLPMPKLQNGVVNPPRCTTGKSKYGEECEYQCEEGYELKGPKKRNCTQAGIWSDPEEKSRCLDITPPVIVCPANITVPTEENENFATVDWDPPQTSDNSGFTPDLVTLPALERPMRFRIGNNIIKYIAHDRRGNTAECEFAVIVEDEQPPVVDKCESPPTFLSRDRAVEVMWEEPIFSDNSGKSVTVKRSHSPGIFPLGDTLVTYEASDEFGNNSTCTITISVQEHACHLPVDPINGNSNCTERSDAVYCSLTCQDGYAFAIRPAQEYFCAYDGQWMPDDNPMPFPDCSITAHSSTVVQDGLIHLAIDSTACEDPFFLNQVETQVKRRIVHKIQEICGDNMVCEVEDLEATCKQLFNEDGELDNELLISRRRKRSLDLVLASPVPDYSDHDYAEPDLPPMDKDIPKLAEIKFKVKSQGVPKEDILLQTMNQVRVALTQAAEQGQLDVAMGGQILPVNQLLFQGETPQFACEPGSVVQGNSCVLCPVGTYFNVMTEDCQPCTRGSYQPSEGHLTCMVCPNNTSTKVANAKSSNECKSQCLPGSFSVDGLEKCSTCHVGTYQPEYAQTECLPCPSNTTTWRRAARKVEECKEMCPAGHVSETGLDPCFPCPVGYYQSQMGQKYCLRCPYGGKTAAAGTGSMNECEYSAEDAEQAEFRQLEPLEINECFSLPCQHGGHCRLLQFGYVCDCRPGFTGMHCETDIDECSSAPCQNNGTCRDAINSYSCQCVLGFTGPNCEVNIDDCASQPCKNGASCTDKVHGYMCECAAGYTGTLCEVDIDECLLANPCKNDARCIDLVANVTCACIPGWTGVHCEENIDDCLSEPCQNGAVCEDLIHAYNCVCPPGYTGVNCEVDINECDSSPCQEGATCLDLLNAFQCVCPPAITGLTCDMKIDQNFLLNFASSGTLDYVALEGLRQDLEEVTVCFWMKTHDKFNYGTPISYATDDEDNALTITDYSGFVFYINGEKVITDVTANDGNWHYFCVTWESQGGRWSMYLDAELKDSGKGLANGTAISRNGTVVLGQEQDLNGGGFSAAESFVGVLYRVDIWNRVLSEDVIARTIGSCDPAFGNVIAWGDFKNGLHGRVKVEESHFCQGCPAPIAPIYGYATVKGQSIYSMAIYRCEDGYKLSPEGNRTCAVHGGWSGEEPVCQRISCGYPGYLVDGQVQGSSYLFGDRVQYVCSKGFVLVGDVTRHCRENGQWSGTAPTCQPVLCPSPSSIENGRVLSSQLVYKLGENITILCEENYKLDGVATLKCLEDGTWEDVLPVCQPILCTQPPKINNGRLETGLESIEVGVVIQYVCDSGFQQDASSTLRCSHDGTWIGSAPDCQPVVCDEPTAIRYATYTLSDPLRYYSSKLRYVCEPGYEIYGTAEFTCDGDAIWQPYGLPACMPVDCGSPPPVLNGQVLADEQTFGSIARLECFSGFTLKGETEMVCTAEGTWSANSSTCVEIYCTVDALEYGHVLNEQLVLPGEVFTYQCDQGYELQGPEKRLCLANGMVNDTRPICSPAPCKVPAGIDNGTYVLVNASNNPGGGEFVLGDVIEYVCEEGYGIKGVSQRTCTAATYPAAGSEWVPAELPTCVPVFCPPLDNIDYGSVVVHGFAVYEEAEYVCRTGFTLEGESHRLCLPNGTWSEEVPICVEVQCPELNPPDNGNIVYTSLTYNSKAFYECDEGYVPNTKITHRICRDNGQWSGLAPACVPRTCAVPEIIEHGYIGYEGNLHVGSTIFYDCEDGYELIGVLERICLPDGTWTEEEPACHLIYCPDVPEVFPNGVVTGNASSYGSVLTFQCDPGYALQGEPQSVCQANKKWEPDFPLCTRVPCPHPGTVPHSYVSQSEPYFFGDNVEYSCYLNYRLQGVRTKNCSLEGTWVPEGPSECVPVVCPSPVIPMHSQVTVDHPHEPVDMIHFAPETVVKVRCDPGYVLYPENTGPITCTSAGTWNEDFPRCQPVTCPALPQLSFGVYEGMDENYNKYLGSVHVTCESGYRLEGSELLRCTQNGTWDGVLPTCRRIECFVVVPLSQHLVLVNEQTQYLVGSTLNVECLPGHVLVGTTSLDCTSTGWSSDFPTCEEIPCPSPPLLVHGQVHSKNNTAIEVTCNPGYILKGTSTWYCQMGTWNIGSTHCEPVTCNLPPKIEHGAFLNTTASEYVYQSVTEYVCNTGYVFKSQLSSSLTCDHESKWHGSTPECTPVTCRGPARDDVSNGQYVFRSQSNEQYPQELSSLNQVPNIYFYPQTFKFGDQIEYECDGGYRIQGVPNLECTAKGTWSSDLPSCERVECPQPVPITDGTYVVSGVHFNDVITYVCKPGHKLVGTAKRLCTQAGTWSGDLPFCDPILCPIPEVPAHAIWHLEGLSVGDSVRFECQPGYVLTGTSTLICLESRKWSETPPTCTQAFCPFVGPLEHGEVSVRKWTNDPVFVEADTLSTDNVIPFKSVATFTCAEKYQLVGAERITCQSNGTWSATLPTCQPKYCSPPAMDENISSVFSSIATGQTLSITCQEGYTLVGPPQITCLTGGVWNAVVLPYCQKIYCPHVPLTLHSRYYYVTGDESNHVPGTGVVYFCEPGFSLQGNPNLTCGHDGRWLGELPVCIQDVCRDPPVVPYSNVLKDGIWPVGAQYRYSCLSGYYLSRSGYLECSAEKKWIGDVPKCLPVNCPQPRAPLSGFLVTINSTFMGVATYACQTGYQLLGQAKRVCQATGTWSGNSPQCQRVWCPELVPPGHGFVMGVSRQYGDKVRFLCEVGYTLHGSEIAQCNATGQWTPSPPICEPASCQDPPPIPHAVATSSEPRSVGSWLRLDCETGYVRHGNLSMQCLPNQIWSAPTGKCERVWCGRPRTPPGITLLGFSYTFSDRLVISCPPGQKSVGHTVIKCQSNGQWSGPIGCVGSRDCQCLNGGACLPTGVCACPPGFSGDRCQTAYCILPCLNGGTCTAPYRCSCRPGYKGLRCEKPTCDPPCANGGRCVAANTCLCPPGYGNPQCLHKKSNGSWSRG